MTTIAIVDYGMGNFHSVARALKYAAPDADIRICNQPHEIDAADRVVFPGQGAMADCMRTLNESGLREAVVKAARSKPRLGQGGRRLQEGPGAGRGGVRLGGRQVRGRSEGVGQEVCHTA